MNIKELHEKYKCQIQPKFLTREETEQILNEMEHVLSNSDTNEDIKIQ